MPHQILKDVFGYDHFRPGQIEVVEALLADQHALAVMPTGSGKSLCFQIPAIIKGGLTIVVSPLVALMEDQVAALKLAGVAADTINSSRSEEHTSELQSHHDLVCRLLLEKKKKRKKKKKKKSTTVTRRRHAH